ncbi:MAG: FAD-binding protein [Chitinophagales bacterium]
MQNQHIIQSTNHKIKHLIIGQGIAGTLLSFRLMQAGEDFLIIDKNKSHTASHIAGASINPIADASMSKSDTMQP